MLDHACVKAHKALFDQTVHFYERALLPLGYSKTLEIPSKAAGFGDGTSATADFWVITSGDHSYPAHVALRAKDRDCVRKFYTSAIEAGGKDNGEPGLRKQIHENCYAAFVHDPAGNNVEAICHNPETE